MRLYIGVDPGVSGGIAAIWDSGRVELAQKMPDTLRGIRAVLVGLAHTAAVASDAVAFTLLERVASSPQMGVVSAMTFGKSVGWLEMALECADLTWETVAPVKWQTQLGCLQAKPVISEEERQSRKAAVALAKAMKQRRPVFGFGSKDKNITKRRAEQLFPGLTITHAIADALLIAEYARRQWLHGFRIHQEGDSTNGQETSGKTTPRHAPPKQRSTRNRAARHGKDADF